jgi:hypothetical protein
MEILPENHSRPELFIAEFFAARNTTLAFCRKLFTTQPIHPKAIHLYVKIHRRVARHRMTNLPQKLIENFPQGF